MSRVIRLWGWGLLLLGVATVVAFLVSFPLLPTISWYDLLTEGFFLALLLATMVLLVKLRLEMIAAGLGVLVYSIFVELLDELVRVAPFWDGPIEWLPRIAGLVLIVYGIYRWQDQLRRELGIAQQVESTVQQRNQELALLHRAGQTFASTLDLGQVLDTVLEEVRHLLGVIACSVWLLDEETSDLVCQRSVGPKSELVRGWRLPAGTGLGYAAVSSGQIVNVPDVQADGRYFTGVDDETGLPVRSVVSVPLQVKDRVIGVIQVVDAKPNRFGPSDLALLEPLAAAAAIAIENARLYRETSQLRAFNENIVQDMHEGILIHNADGVITFGNPRFCELMECTLGELEGLHWSEVVPSEYVPSIEAETAKRPQGIASQYEAALLSRTGRRIPIIVSARPMFQGDELDGVLTVFTDITERVQSEQALAKRAQQMAALYETSLEINAQLDLEALLKALVRRAADLVDVRMGGLYLVRPDGETLELVVSYNLPRDYRGTVIQFGEGVSGRIAQTGQSYQVADYLGWDGTAPVYEGSPFRRVLGVPLKVGDVVIGVLNVTDDKQPGLFDDDQVRLVSLFADQAAIAVNNARLFDSVRHQADQLEALRQVSQDLMALHDLDTLLRQIVERAIRLLDGEAGGVTLYRPDLEKLEWKLAVGSEEYSRPRMMALDEGLVGKVWLTGESVIVNDYQNWPDRSPQWPGLTGAEVAVPVRWGDELLGVLNVDSVSQRFTEEDARLLEQFAGQAAIAIQNARLLTRIQEHAGQIQQVIDTVPDGVLLLDREQRILLANPAAQRHLAGLTTSRVGEILNELDGLPLAKLLVPPPPGLLHEVRVERVPPQVFEVIAQSLGAVEPAGGWVMVVREVTEEREIQRHLQQQERLAAVGQLAAGIAHDFNNILASIVLYADLMLRAPEMEDRHRERLKTIHQQGRRAADLVQQILDFGRRAILERRPLDLKAFLEDMQELLRRTLPESIHLHLKYGPDDHIINGDQTRIQQVVMNLALNARDAMPDGGDLHFELERFLLVPGRPSPFHEMEPGQWIRLTVTDTGSGIPAEYLPHIFEPFFTTKEVGKGTGLGLSQVYGIVKQHDGFIQVASPAGERGTRFVIYLPALALSPVPDEPARRDPAVAGGGETILVVEDDPTTREALCDIMQALGYQVLAAANGREALAVLEQRGEQIVLLLSDLVMPEMGGAELFKAAHQMLPALKMVVLTGYPLGDEGEELQSAGVVGWLQKPVDLDHLAQVVAQVLA